MKFPVTVAFVLVALFICGVSPADDAPKKPQKSRGKIVNRLPNNYGKIALDDTQRKKIYSIQTSYRSKMQALLRELEDLRSQQNLEIQSVLSVEQTAQLKTILEVSRKKREANRAKKK